MTNQSLPSLGHELRVAHSQEHVERPAGIKGGFRLCLSTGVWWWSPGMFRLHGYGPTQWSSVRPSARLMLTHRHPADRPEFAQAWAHLLSDGGMIAVRYRIIGVDGRIRPVFAMACLEAAEGGRPREITGVMQSDGAPIQGPGGPEIDL